MKQWCCLWGFICLCLMTTAQDNPGPGQALQAGRLKKGLYRSFREFRENNPSESGDLVIKSRSTAAQIYLLASRNELVLRDAAGQEQKVKNYWGFCDGTNIYIKDNGLNRIQAFGYYCTYELQGVQPARSAYNPADMTVNAMNTPVRLKKVINIVSGEILELSLYNLKKYILPQDPALLEEFRNDKAKRDKLDYYISRFNERNKPPQSGQ
ncbi:hypothetical protein HGH92_11530 [Chitinophaga varians]|uniref:DUF4468 domain-containing protein n=1 Tax=Chitinophaga varians TaxID=2202339 RepID=A0A847RPF5_9BACT|nr:hypothetical protein [Chitinophaga varians]NLR64936.1 hypothetical protein [Chitinophaga varians]